MFFSNNSNQKVCTIWLNVYWSWVTLLCSLCATGVLRVRVYAAGFLDSHYCHCLCDHCGDILLVKCWKLSLAVDFLLLCCLDSCLCVSVLSLLLLCEDQDVRLLSDQLLFWIHFDVLPWIGNPMRWVSLVLWNF